MSQLSLETVKKCLTTEYEKYSDRVGVEKRVPDLDKLTMRDYQLIFNKLWDSFNSLQHIDKSLMRKLLEEARIFRNDVMHFRIVHEVSEEKNPCDKILRLLPSN